MGNFASGGRARVGAALRGAASRGAASRRGAAALEFALVAPLFLMMLGGIVAGGLYIGISQAVQQIAADAARRSVAGLTEAERRAIVTRFLAAEAGTYFLVDPSRVRAEVRPGTTAASWVVEVRYDTSWLPIWQFAGLVPLPDPTVVRSAVILQGGA